MVVYSIPKAILCLVDQGMSYEEAEEYLEFNSIGAWVGERTPMWIVPVEQLVETFAPDTEDPELVN